jgi:PknH-like extracellular domain
MVPPRRAAPTAMTDLANSLSDQRCLGSLYNAQQQVYADTDWIGVVDQVLTQPGTNSGDQPDGDTRERVEQTVVQVPSDQHALDFFNESRKNWTYCMGKDVNIDDGAAKIDWHIEGIGSAGTTMIQTMRRTGGTKWGCQHTLGVRDSYIVEASVCNPDPAGEAMQLVNRIMAGIT